MIDVIIPTRNAPEVLALTLAHYWANAYDPAFVASTTLLDNCSDAPGMEAVLGGALERGCRVIRHEQNIGVWASINRGMSLARSAWILVLTSDVLLAPGAIRTLLRIRQEEASKGLRVLGPVVADGMASLPWLYGFENWASTEVNYDHYNGACWLMDRQLLLDDGCLGIGFFDPRFYVCFGDVDYMQRVRDAGHSYAVTPLARCLHLDKQSRRHDHTEGQDTQIEMRDAERFHEKWRDRPDVLAKHPKLSAVLYAVAKAGWKEAIPL